MIARLSSRSSRSSLSSFFFFSFFSFFFSFLSSSHSSRVILPVSDPDRVVSVVIVRVVVVSVACHLVVTASTAMRPGAASPPPTMGCIGAMYTTSPRAVRTGRSDVTGSIGTGPCANGTITGWAMASASGRLSHPELVVWTTGSSGVGDASTTPAISSRTTGRGPIGVRSIRSRKSPEVGPARTTTFTNRSRRSEDLLILARKSFSFSRCFAPVSCSSRPFAGTSQSHVAQR
mmetsp:Transcript_10908/g.45440  ORF Transcript_10908/g.45440 Transcript_10908/m.45440 type:complete len:232 (+) Transcript_10908:298-993(+)